MLSSNDAKEEEGNMDVQSKSAGERRIEENRQYWNKIKSRENDKLKYCVESIEIEAIKECI